MNRIVHVTEVDFIHDTVQLFHTYIDKRLQNNHKIYALKKHIAGHSNSSIITC